MSSLTDRAAAAAQQPEAPMPAVPPESETEPVGIQDLGVDYEVADGDPEMVPVHLAWLRVRRDVRAIAKRELYNGGGTKFNFRGVDTVVNCFGPVTLKHGVNVFPVGVDAVYRDTTTSKGNKMRECTATVRWLVMGPMGDQLPTLLETQGEALDSADKGTAKAQSVALRVLLLTGGLTPTTDTDPDSVHVDRGDAAPVKSPEQYRDEMVNPRTSVERLNQIADELTQFHLGGIQVQNENGDMEALWALGLRLYKERGGNV